MKAITRVPSVPLITNDPYFSIWSPADQLFDTETKSWTGANKPIRGKVIVNDTVYTFMGENDGPTLQQTMLDITPTKTIYGFEGESVSLEVTFTSPLILYDLELVSRPATYIDVRVKSLNDEKQDVEVLFEFDERICHQSQEREKMFGATESFNDVSYAWMGKAKQTPLGHTGDNIDIDWGYLYVASEKESPAHIKYLPVDGDQDAGIQAKLIFDQVDKEGDQTFLSVAYDDVLSIMYFDQATKAYWARNGATIYDVLESSIDEHDQIIERTHVFDQQLSEKAIEKGGKEYELITSLSYRQAIAAHKLIVDENDQVIFLSKRSEERRVGKECC